MRKTTSRFAAAILAVATLAASAVMATAPARKAQAVTTAWPTSEIVVHSAMQGATFEAYRLLNSTDDGNEKYSYTLRTDRDASTSGIQVSDNDTNITNVLTTVTGKTSASDIYNLLAKKSSASMEQLLKSVYTQLSSGKIPADYTATAEAAEETEPGNPWAPYAATFKDIPQGWYLIVPTSSMTASDPATASGITDSVLIANTANSTKDREGNPGVDLEIKPNIVQVTSATDQKTESAQYQNDYAVGTSFTWSAAGTVPEYFSAFSPLKYAFNVTLPKGVTADSEDANHCPMVAIYAVNPQDTDFAGKDQTPTTTQISGFNSTKNQDGSCTYGIDDLTQAKEASDSTKSITLKYDTKIRLDMKAKLNANATNGKDGNVISATVSYPGSMLDPTVSRTTAASTATLYTYKLTINNTSNDNKALSNGAKYSLYSCDDNGCDTQIGTETEVSGTDASAVFSGLDSGSYEVRETTVPAGYSGASPVNFTVTSNFNNGTVTLTSNNNAVTTTDASMVIQMKNTSNGGLLPSTGGAGVVIMYVCGVLLIGGALAGIIVATSRRNRE
ncbi:SpaA isopeptide-forming pilin-related protein [Bifidobacterium thermophilum]|uniref:SpaA isopeptide-forming pilin-related protein n=1 Tax=Bifidobacterium thermophilum TaxID=33905 RepID=UPI00399365FD